MSHTVTLPVSESASPFTTPTQRISQRDRGRVDSLSCQEIGFVHNPDFEILRPEQVSEETPELFDSKRLASPVEPDAGSPAPQLPDCPLLTPEGETYLFRKYNYLKYRANVLRSLLNHQPESVLCADQIEELLRSSAEIRDQIASANLRLVASVARRYSQNDHEFDELFAEGSVILLGAIEKFDYSRGFRFSTYATHSIQRHYFRVLKRRQRRRKQEHADADALSAVPEREEVAVTDAEELGHLRQLVARWDECLSGREQEILESRFGLGSGSRPRTLKSISRDVGLSKERVRQIQMRALEKLREFAAAEGLRVEL